MTRIVIRGFVGKKILFEDHLEVEEATLEEILPRLAKKHGKAMAQHRLHMIEIEFLDEPDPEQRFFRFGTDPRAMVKPLRVRLDDPHS